MTAKEQMIQFSLEISQAAPIWTQGFGGNVSSKGENTLIIKASGTRLGSVTTTEGWVSLAQDSMYNSFHSLRASSSSDAELEYSTLLKDRRFIREGKSLPSMETGFHSLLPRQYVLHFHSIPALLMAHAHKHSPDKMAAWLRNRWGSDGVIFYGPLRPGWELARVVCENPHPTINILENHGIIIHSDSKSILQEWKKTETEFCNDWGFPELAKVLNSNNPLQTCREWMGPNARAPLKIYFPDTAVFLDQLLASLVPEEGLFYLPEDFFAKDLNLFELWLATAVIFKLCPQLEELPSAISSGIAHLPLEIIRRNIAEKVRGK